MDRTVAPPERPAIVDRRLPIIRRPLPDELMSSWLMRNARANAMRSQELVSLIGGRSKQLFWQDLDVIGCDVDLLGIERLLHRSRAELCTISLESDLDRLTLGADGKNRSIRWLLPRSAKVGRPEARWIQFCPRCLAEDETPYFRRHWRLAFCTICTRHRCALRDTCAACGGIFSFHLIDRNKPALEADLALSICPTCRHDARRDFSARAESISPRLCLFQARLEAAWRAGFVDVSTSNTGGWLYVGQLFDVFHRLIAQINLSSRLRDWFAADVMRLTERDIGPWQQFGLPFVRWPQETRRFVFEWIANAFSVWPTRFVAGARRHKASYKDVCGERERLPYWFERTMDTSIRRSWYVPTAEETANAIRFLQGCKVPPTFFAVRRSLGRWYPKPTSENSEIEQRQLQLFDREQMIARKAEWITRCIRALQTYVDVSAQALANRRIGLSTTSPAFRVQG